MEERPLYENTFNRSAITERRYRWIAVTSLVLSLGVLVLFLLR